MTLKNQTIEEILYEIKVDLASVKTDISWLKRIFSVIIISIGLFMGVDISGVI